MVQQLLVIAAVILIILGLLGILNIVAVPGVTCLVLGIICGVVAAVLGGSFGRSRL